MHCYSYKNGVCHVILNEVNGPTIYSRNDEEKMDALEKVNGLNWKGKDLVAEVGRQNLILDNKVSCSDNFHAFVN